MAQNLLAQLEQAEAEAARLRRAIAQGPCREYGHDWCLHGGANAGCGPDCGCSVPVHICAKCGDCDYGDNPEGADIRATCAALHRDAAPTDTTVSPGG